MTYGKILGALEYMTVLLIILDCNTPYRTAIGNPFHIPELTSLFIILLFLFKCIANRKIRVSILKRWSCYFVPYYVLILLYAVNSVKLENMLSFTTRFLVSLPVMTLLFCLYIDEQRPYQLLLKYADLISCIAAISLVFWVFASQLHWVSPTGHIRAKWGPIFNYPSYYGLYFERQREQFLWYDGLRNQGVFCEAPMYGLNLIIAISIELFLRPLQRTPRYAVDRNGNTVSMVPRKKRTSLTRMILLVITLITTVTTTGMILLILILFMEFLLTQTKERITLLLKVFACIIGGACCVAAAVGIFTLKATTTNSWMVRVASYTDGFNSWLQSPIWGMGYLDNEALGIGSVNSITTILARGGLALGAVYLVPFISNLWTSFHKKERYFLAFCVVFVLEYIFTTFAYTFFALFVVSLLTARIVEKKPMVKAA